MSFGQSPLWSFGEKDFQTNTPWTSCTPSTNDSCTSFSPTSISPPLRTQELFSPSPSTSLSQSLGSSQSKVEWSPSHFGFWFFHSTPKMRQKGTQTYRLNRHDYPDRQTTARTWTWSFTWDIPYPLHTCSKHGLWTTSTLHMLLLCQMCPPLYLNLLNIQ